MLTSLEMGSAEHLRILAVGGLALAACGGESALKLSAVHDRPGASGEDGGTNTWDLAPKSGSRLTVLPYSPSFPAVRDADRNIGCTPRLAADGVERCLPYFPRQVHFTDGNCTLPVVVRGLGPPALCHGSDEYFTDDGGAVGCFAPGMAVYTAGASIEPPSQLFGYRAGSCTPVDVEAAMGSVLEFHEAVPSEPAKWVELTEDVVPVTDSLAVVNWTGADGSRIRSGFRLIPSGVACDRYPDPNLSPEPQPASWCVPAVRARADFTHPKFADDQCSGERLAASCAPTEVVESEGSAIPPLYEGGAPVSPVYASEGGKCTLVSPQDPSSRDASLFYSPGPRLEPSRYPSLSVARSGTGRIQTAYLQSAGVNLAAEAFFDTKYDQRCTPMPLSSGGTWCVPGAVWVDSSNLTAFADPTCTRRLVVSASRPDDPLAPFRFGLLFPDNRACRPTEYPALHSIQEYGGSAFEQIGQACVPFAAQGSTPLLFELGEELDPSTVVEKMP